MITEHIEKETQLRVPEVVLVDFKTFLGLEKKYPHARDINMNTFSELQSNEVVTNVGAAPCLIIWEFDQKAGVMKRSGHFPDVSKEAIRRLTARRLEVLSKEFQKGNSEQLAIANDEQIARFGNPDKKESNDSYSQFIRMGDQVAHEIKSGQTEKVIFLFGQNFVVYPDGIERSRSITKNALEHFVVTTTIRQWGVPESRIIDHRSPDHNGGDNTLYVPGKNTIYHFHRKKNEPYPYD